MLDTTEAPAVLTTADSVIESDLLPGTTVIYDLPTEETLSILGTSSTTTLSIPRTSTTTAFTTTTTLPAQSQISLITTSKLLYLIINYRFYDGKMVVYCGF